jgi:hypothetical protein
MATDRGGHQNTRRMVVKLRRHFAIGFVRHGVACAGLMSAGSLRRRYVGPLLRSGGGFRRHRRPQWRKLTSVVGRTATVGDGWLAGNCGRSLQRSFAASMQRQREEIGRSDAATPHEWRRGAPDSTKTRVGWISHADHLALIHLEANRVIDATNLEIAPTAVQKSPLRGSGLERTLNGRCTACLSATIATTKS